MPTSSREDFVNNPTVEADPAITIRCDIDEVGMTQAPLKVLVAMANLHDHQVVSGLLGATSVLVHSDHVNEGRAAMQALRDDRLRLREPRRVVARPTLVGHHA